MSTPVEQSPESGPAEVEPQAQAPEIGPDNPPWGTIGAVGVWLGSVVLIIFLPLFFVLPYALRQGVLSDPARLAEFALSDRTAVFLQIASILPAHLLTLGLAWLVVTQLGKYPFLRTLGWQWDARFGFWKSAALAVGLLALGGLIIRLSGGSETQLDKIISSSVATAYMTAFIATATAPLVEEVIYRGILYSALQRLIGKLWAVLLVLTLFALIHVPQYKENLGVVFIICLLSAFLTFIRAYTGKLLPCFVVHLIFNGIQSSGIVLDPLLKRFSHDAGQSALCLPTLAHLFAALF